MATTTGIGVHDQNLERQMGGCMSGFFNLFDRSQILPGKRLYPKRLPPPLPVSNDVPDSSSEPSSFVGSPVSSREFKITHVQISPKSDLRSPAVDRPNSPLAVTTFERKESVKSPWKFTRETPRLSLDSRANVDAKGGLHRKEIRINTSGGRDSAEEERENQQRRSPSVIARLMGLEPVPTNSSSVSGETPEKQTELRRSASESRSRDYVRFFDAPNYFSTTAGVKTELSGERKSDQSVKCNPKAKNQNIVSNKQRRLMVEKKSFYDTSDFFPAPEIIPAKYEQHHHQAVAIYGEIERRLRMRGIDEPSKDLETLKHILEALQLKGLLHSSTATTTTKHHQNVVHDRRFSADGESPIVLIKSARRTLSPVNRRQVSYSGEPSISPRREKPTRPGRVESNRSSTPRKGGPLSIETQRRGGETTTPRTSAQSPKKCRRSSDNYNRTDKLSPRSRRSTAEICHDEKKILCGPTPPEDEASTVSESCYSTSSHTDNERYWRAADGRNMLERCDKLLHNIAEMNSNSNSNPNSAELQKPSPVSVLDSSFYKDDESSPSPVKKRAIDFKDAGAVLMELEDEQWTPPSSITTHLLPKHPYHHLHLHSSDGSDFSYVSAVFEASMYLPHETDLFLLLEKHISIRNINKGNNSSKASILQRKLIFDTITEILGRARELPPWSSLTRPTMGQIWAEFLKFQERGPADDLLEVICGVLKKDLAGDSINGWGDCHMEMSDAVLDIERLIFKDLIGETIGDLALLGGKRVGDQALRRKLVF